MPAQRLLLGSQATPAPGRRRARRAGPRLSRRERPRRCAGRPRRRPPRGRCSRMRFSPGLAARPPARSRLIGPGGRRRRRCPPASRSRTPTAAAAGTSARRVRVSVRSGSAGRPDRRRRRRCRAGRRAAPTGRPTSATGRPSSLSPQEPGRLPAAVDVLEEADLAGVDHQPSAVVLEAVHPVGQQSRSTVRWPLAARPAQRPGGCGERLRDGSRRQRPARRPPGPAGEQSTQPSRERPGRRGQGKSAARAEEIARAQRASSEGACPPGQGHRPVERAAGLGPLPW